MNVEFYKITSLFDSSTLFYHLFVGNTKYFGSENART